MCYHKCVDYDTTVPYYSFSVKFINQFFYLLQECTMTLFEFIKYAYATIGPWMGTIVAFMTFLFVFIPIVLGPALTLGIRITCTSQGWDVQALFNPRWREFAVTTIIGFCSVSLFYVFLWEPKMRGLLEDYEREEREELAVQEVLDSFSINEVHPRTTLQFMLQHRRMVGSRQSFVYLNSPIACIYRYKEWVKARYPDSDFFYHLGNLRDMQKEQLEKLGPATKENYANCINIIDSLRVLWKEQMNYEETCLAFVEQLKLKNPNKELCYVSKFP